MQADFKEAMLCSYYDIQVEQDNMKVKGQFLCPHKDVSMIFQMIHVQNMTIMTAGKGHTDWKQHGERDDRSEEINSVFDNKEKKCIWHDSSK